MKFEEKIIAVSEVRQKNLMRAAKIASDAPDTGVTIVKKGAYYVIKDCADITQKYLAHLSYSSLKTPIVQLKGKFTQADIIDFVGRSKVNPETRQLLHIILTDIGSVQYRNAVSQIAVQPISVDFTVPGNDVYGDYDAEVTPTAAVVATETEVNVDSVSSVINKLIEVFAAIQ